jgi:rod shape-determining protein MreD
VIADLTRSAWVRLPLVLAVALALQMSVATELRPFGVAPDLMLLLAVCGGLAAGQERGAVAGFVIGVAFDLQLQTPFGLSALVYALTAFGLGYLRLGIERSGWLVRSLAVTGASAVAVVAYALLGSLFGMTDVVDLGLVTIALVVAVVNGLLTPIAYPLMRWTLTAGERVPV